MSDLFTACPMHCGVFILWSPARPYPRHTRSVRGVGWGGKAMHLTCPGSGYKPAFVSGPKG